ncbi:TetR/AcrR family transcriptional regulator [Sinomonas sp. R1AF57]|uniref:TetR/AcrR family transcriptional regulator n=1 Tax=Sinomonas sp. R1AF57 TaxID=2020377 RepID=UPI000B605382|nr:TetR/AcrR family transcriptional regulator [Sinomonas sp. R1AF57]ASN50996.1 TetR family transcriptional regulator [Sinomonas sp. R1AF57]
MSARRTGTRERLFAAAMELIGQRGTDAVTVDEIAAAAGVAKGTVYYNFGSKNELVAQLLEYGMALLMDALRPGHVQAGGDLGGTGGDLGGTGGDLGGTGGDLGEVRGMVERALGFIEAYPAFVRLWMGEQWRADGAWQPVLSGMRARVVAEIRAALERLAARRRPREGQDLDMVALAVFGAAFVVGTDRAADGARPLGPSIEAVVGVVAGAFEPPEQVRAAPRKSESQS